jgi:hypothetical protein
MTVTREYLTAFELGDGTSSLGIDEPVCALEISRYEANSSSDTARRSRIRSSSQTERNVLIAT